MAKKPNRVISEQQKEQDMATQNLKRKKNNNLKDQKRTRASKNPAIVTPLSDKQTSKRAEEALQEIEERFRLAFENANIGMCLVDLQRTGSASFRSSGCIIRSSVSISLQNQYDIDRLPRN